MTVTQPLGRPSSSRGNSTRRVVLLASVLLLILITASLYGKRIGFILSTDLSADADEAGHFTTGMMFYDYLHMGMGKNPISFAKSYYARYPKVAIGHWPPLFYVVQASWFSLTGPSVLSARLLCGLLALLLGGLLWWEARRHFGSAAAWVAVGLLFATPVMVGQYGLVMSDALVGLCMLAAALSLLQALETSSRTAMAIFVLSSLLAIWGKGTGWGIGFYAASLPLVVGRSIAYRSPWYWTSGVLILAGGMPFYLLASRLGFGYSANIDSTLATGEESRLSRIRPLLDACPWFLLLAAAAGLFVLWHTRAGHGGRQWRVARAMLALVLTQLVMHFSLGLLGDQRYYVPSAAALALLAAAAFAFAGRLARPWDAWAPAALTLSLCAAILVSPQMLIPSGFTGFRTASQQIPAPGTVVLVASDVLGEGALIVERLLADPSRKSPALRASKLLSEADWNGQHYQLLTRTDAEIVARLEQIPIHYVLIENRLPTAQMPPHFQLLDRVLREHPEVFSLQATVPVRLDGVSVGSGIRIYRNLQTIARPMGGLRFQIGRGRGEAEYVP